MISSKQKKVPMKIYIVERDNPSYKPEPEVFTDGNKALHIVQEEYTNQMEVLGTSQEKSDAGYGSCGCYWNFEDGEYCGDALIDQDCDGDRWEWRITERIIESQHVGLDKLTNADKIRVMTNEELAQIIECPYSTTEELCDRDIGCMDCCKKWLESDTGDETIKVLKKTLKEFHIPECYYSIEKYAEESVCLERDSSGWMVYGGERGCQHDRKLHEDCRDACLDVICRVAETIHEEKRLTDFFNMENEKLIRQEIET